MAGIKLYDYQLDAVKRMKNGCILCGGVGSGKSRTSLAYYYLTQGGTLGGEKYEPMNDPPLDLYIITTARKRDTMEWEGELIPFLLSTKDKDNLYSNKVIIDSWNNIKKYKNIDNAFFIFDEQRVVGSGEWSKSFINIARHNKWILLSATPGDSWSDYIPVFIANGYFKNRTQFNNEHVIYSRFSKYPKIDRYINTGKLIRLRKNILIDMDFNRKTKSHNIVCHVKYDKTSYKTIMKERWNIFNESPIVNASELCYSLRKLVNSDYSRVDKVIEIFKSHPKIIIFYNFDYELDILLNIDFGSDVNVAQWNGHKHQEMPSGKKWVYLVQYTAGAEGWNCITTDTIIFFSQNYSYKILEQAKGRIDRLNTPFMDLYYYYLISTSNIDLAINKALKNKKNFNEGKFTTPF